MQDIFAALISFFLIQPLQAEVAERLAGTRVPQEVLTEVTTCMSAAAPVIIDRATEDPGWAVSNALGIWFGTTQPEAVLIEAVPSCESAVEAARPFLTGA